MTAAFLLKAPIPGLVKTRLAADLGKDAACRAYQALVERQLAEIPEDWKTVIFYTPANTAETFRQWLGADLTFIPQPEGDLGDRQQAAVAECLPEPVALIGGDCPYLTSSILKQVAAELESYDLAMVPAVDGGYVTLAMKQWHQGLLADIQWSTASVATKLEENARFLRITLKKFSPSEDVDTVREWIRACNSLPELKF